MASEDLECNMTCLYTACLRSVFAINTCDCTYICLLRVLYCSEVGRFRVGVRCSSGNIHLYKIIPILLQMHANH